VLATLYKLAVVLTVILLLWFAIHPKRTSYAPETRPARQTHRRQASHAPQNFSMAGRISPTIRRSLNASPLKLGLASNHPKRGGGKKLHELGAFIQRFAYHSMAKLEKVGTEVELEVISDR